MWLKRLFFRRQPDNTYLKNFLFGVEDSLVSTVGLLAGVAAANVSRGTIITTGIVLIVVEGFSMGIGSFLTEETTEEINGEPTQDFKAIRGGLTMLASYIVAGLLPLSPYFFLNTTAAMPASIVMSLLGLLGLGFGTSLFFHSSRPVYRAVKTMLMGGLAVGVGITIGKIFHL